MKIALFTDTFLPTVNGVARALGLLVNYANVAGHEVGLVTPPLPGGPYEGVAFHVKVPGLPVPFYPELHLCQPWLGGKAKSTLRGFAPDLVHAATEASVGWAGRSWAKAHDVPLVTSYCTNFADYLSGYRMDFLRKAVWSYLRFFHGGAQYSVAPSHDTLNTLRERDFQGRLTIWSRGVDSESFNPMHRNPSIRRDMAPGAGVVLLYVGRVAAEKRIDLLLEAFPRIRDRASRPVALVIVGDGPPLEEYRARNIQGVHFTGYRRGQLLSATYASADIFVFPSDTETFGQVVTEAFASGLPAVVPRRGGVTDLVIEGQTGSLFDPGNAEDLAETALSLIRRDQVRWEMAANARAAAERRSWKEAFDELFRIYQDALATGHVSVTEHSPSRQGREPILQGSDGAR